MTCGILVSPMALTVNPLSGDPSKWLYLINF